MKVDQKLKHINTDQQVLYTYQQFTTSSNIRQFSHLPFHPSLSTTHHNERGLYSSNDNNNVKYCSTSNNSNISDNNMQHTFHKVNSMNKINNSVNSSSNNNNNSNIVNNSNNTKTNFNITTFTNKNECHSSYISVTLHILYEMPFIRSFFLNMKSISLPDNANKHNVITLLQQLKQIFIKCSESSKQRIDLSKFSYTLSQTFNNSFQYNTPNDPIDVYFALVNLIHDISSSSTTSKDDNCTCIVHQHLHINLTKEDECECSSIINSKLPNNYYLIDIPTLDILKQCTNHSDKVYYNIKEKLFDFFKKTISYNPHLQCPLNGKYCNYNRIKRTIHLHNNNNNTNLLTYIPFILESLNETTFNIDNVISIYIMIPLCFNIDSVFNINTNDKQSERRINKYELIGCVFMKRNMCSYSCAVRNNNEHCCSWIYYDEECYNIFTYWKELIWFCVRNYVFPYMLLYKAKTNNERVDSNGNGDDNALTKEDIKKLIDYVNIMKDYISNKQHTNSIMRCKDKLFASKDENYKNRNSPINCKYISSQQHKSNEMNIVDKVKKCENMPLQQVSSKIKKTSSKISQPINNTNTNNNAPTEQDPSSINVKVISAYTNIPSNQLYNISSSSRKQDIPLAKSLDIKQLLNLNNQGDIISYKEAKQNTDNVLIRNVNTNYQFDQKNKKDDIMYDFDLQTVHKNIWICSNCNTNNQFYVYKCRKCTLINNKQKEIIEKTTNKILHLNRQNNTVNNFYKRIKCICYSDNKDKIIQNGSCPYCHRTISKDKHSLQKDSIPMFTISDSGNGVNVNVNANQQHFNGFNSEALTLNSNSHNNNNNNNNNYCYKDLLNTRKYQVAKSTSIVKGVKVNNPLKSNTIQNTKKINEYRQQYHK